MYLFRKNDNQFYESDYKILERKYKMTDKSLNAQNMPITILAQYVKDASFENPNVPDSLRAGLSAPKMDININMDARKIEDKEIKSLYEVMLRLSATAKRDEDTVFIAEVEYGSTVQVNDIPEEQHHPLLLIEIPRIIFPFARNIISDMTQQGGYPPLMLNPVDFHQLYMQQFGDIVKKAE